MYDFFTFNFINIILNCFFVSENWKKKISGSLNRGYLIITLVTYE
jgi:hypothetical protein